MLGLKLPTDPRWVNIVESNIEEILTDHAWCEQKAVSNAITLITYNPELTDLVNEMIKIALKIKPNYVCIVPEKRKEITTEGGLNLKKKTYYLKKIIGKFNSKNIRTSLFINPSIKDVIIANQIGTKCIELHTGKFCNSGNNKKKYLIELNKIKKCMILGKNLGLEVHAGHGLTYKTTKIITKLNGLKELNIGHFIIGESIFNGLKKTISNFKNIIKK